MKLDEVISQLNSLADPDKVLFKEKKYGITSHNALGIYHKDLKELAKEIKTDSELAIQLFETGIYEARLLCSKIFDVKDLSDDLIETWTSTFENWEVCDSFCMGLFAKSKFAEEKITTWSTRTNEFEKRASFATLAAYCMSNKHDQNETFISFLSLIIKESSDNRIYVKKAVNWALRNIGKRNIDLKDEAIKTARMILQKEDKASVWIAKNALQELTKDNLRSSDYPRSIYRTK